MFILQIQFFIQKKLFQAVRRKNFFLYKQLVQKPSQHFCSYYNRCGTHVEVTYLDQSDSPLMLFIYLWTVVTREIFNSMYLEKFSVVSYLIFAVLK